MSGVFRVRVGPFSKTAKLRPGFVPKASDFQLARTEAS